MDLLFAHLCLATASLGLLAVCLRLLLPSLAQRPHLGYMAVLGVLGLGLLGSGVQVAMQGRGLPESLPLASRVPDMSDLVKPEAPLTNPTALPIAAAPSAVTTEAPFRTASYIRPAPADQPALFRTAAVQPALPTQALTPAASISWPRTFAWIYLIGAGIAVLRLLRQCIRSWHLIRNTQVVSNPRALAAWNALPNRPTDVLLRESSELTVPACTGLLRRTVLLPPAELLPDGADALRCVLTHELVHLERGDSWSLLLQESFRALFWFHPAAWWLIARLDLLRELSCDQQVLRLTKLPKSYADALLQCAAGMNTEPQASVALVPLSRSQTQLRRRIEMLFKKPNSQGNRATWIPVGMAASAAAVLCSAQVALAAGYEANDPFYNAEPGAVQQDDLGDAIKKLVKSKQEGKVDTDALEAEIEALVKELLAEQGISDDGESKPLKVKLKNAVKDKREHKHKTGKPGNSSLFPTDLNFDSLSADEKAEVREALIEAQKAIAEIQIPSAQDVRGWLKEAEQEGVPKELLGMLNDQLINKVLGTAQSVLSQVKSVPEGDVQGLFSMIEGMAGDFGNLDFDFNFEDFGNLEFDGELKQAREILGQFQRSAAGTSGDTDELFGMIQGLVGEAGVLSAEDAAEVKSAMKMARKAMGRLKNMPEGDMNALLGWASAFAGDSGILSPEDAAEVKQAFKEATKALKSAGIDGSWKIDLKDLKQDDFPFLKERSKSVEFPKRSNAKLDSLQKRIEAMEAEIARQEAELADLKAHMNSARRRR